MIVKRRYWWSVVLAFVLATGLGGWLWLGNPKHGGREMTQKLPKTISIPALQATNLAPEPLSRARDWLRASITGLRKAGDRNEVLCLLAQLRQQLLGGPKAGAVSAIRESLDAGTDVSTGLGFKVGADGFLTEAPTLRAFLLDWLGQLEPGAAADYARIILNHMDSADEWAVALRNLARGDASAEGRALLEQKLEQMLRYGAWQQNPSVGYLEAFDAAVFLGGTKLVPALAELVRKQDNPAVAHAAYLALDRLVIQNASQVLGTLSAAPELMQGREQTRADFFARADVREPQQRRALEQYLLDPHRSAAELAQFAGVYPNANYMISQNLLTAALTPDRAALASRDAASLAALQEWLADPRFERMRPQLEKARRRLEEFARQAARN